MRVISKWNLLIALTLTLIVGNMVHAASSCGKKVKEYCQFNTCNDYCNLKGIEKADCDCRRLCSPESGEVLLTDLNTKQIKVCESGSTNWKQAKTEEWLERTRTANRNPFYNVCLGEMTVKEATAFCEPVIINHCKQVTAPKYCEIKRMERCDVDALCVLDLNSARLAAKKRNSDNEQPTTEDEDLNEEDRAANNNAHREEDALLKRNTDHALDAQNSAQLMACVAAKRDPFNQKTGRSMMGCSGHDKLIPWCKIAAPSWRDTVETPADKADRKKSICSGNEMSACSSAEEGMNVPEGIQRRRGGDECAARGREDAARKIFSKKRSWSDESISDEPRDGDFRDGK